MNSTNKPLMTETQLTWSGVVANSRMNRERGLTGRNSYHAELRFDVLAFLKAKLRSASRVKWLDLCCGRGRAILEIEETLPGYVSSGQLELIGVDLVDHFERPKEKTAARLITANIDTWSPAEKYDLITCIHGLHYVGDKLGIIQRACRWLTAKGEFLAHLDLKNIRSRENRDLTRILRRWFREAEFDFHPRFRLLRCSGCREISWKCRYLGADDQAGPNFTGQPAVNSFYEVTS